MFIDSKGKVEIRQDGRAVSGAAFRSQSPQEASVPIPCLVDCDYLCKLSVMEKIWKR